MLPIPTNLVRFRKPLNLLLETINKDRGKYIFIGTLDNYVTVWYCSSDRKNHDMFIEHSQSYTQYYATTETVIDVVAYVVTKYNVCEEYYMETYNV